MIGNFVPSPQNATIFCNGKNISPGNLSTPNCSQEFQNPSTEFQMESSQTFPPENYQCSQLVNIGVPVGDSSLNGISHFNPENLQTVSQQMENQEQSLKSLISPLTNNTSCTQIMNQSNQIIENQPTSNNKVMEKNISDCKNATTQTTLSIQALRKHLLQKKLNSNKKANYYAQNKNQSFNYTTEPNCQVLQKYKPSSKNNEKITAEGFYNRTKNQLIFLNQLNVKPNVTSDLSSFIQKCIKLSKGPLEETEDNQGIVIQSKEGKMNIPQDENLSQLLNQPVMNQQFMYKSIFLPNPVREEAVESKHETKLCKYDILTAAYNLTFHNSYESVSNEQVNSENLSFPIKSDLSTPFPIFAATVNQKASPDNLSTPNKPELCISILIINSEANQRLPLENNNSVQNFEKIDSDSDSDSEKNLVIDEDAQSSDELEEPKPSTPETIYEPMVFEIPSNVDMTKKIKELFAKTVYCPIVNNKCYLQNFNLWEKYKEMVAQNIYQPIIYKEKVDECIADGESIHQLLVHPEDSSQPIICGEVHPESLNFWDKYKELISETVYQPESDDALKLDDFYLWEKYKELIVKTVHQSCMYSQEMPAAQSSSDFQAEEEPVANTKEISKEKNEPLNAFTAEKTGSYPTQTSKTICKAENKYYIPKIFLPKTDFKCYMCGAVFTAKEELNEHVISMHTDIRITSCSMCSKTFINASLLNAHWIKNHSNIEHLICVVCLRESSTEFEVLRRHIFNTHYISSSHPLFKIAYYVMSPTDVDMEEKKRKQVFFQPLPKKKNKKNVLHNICAQPLRQKLIEKFRLFFKKKIALKAARRAKIRKQNI